MKCYQKWLLAGAGAALVGSAAAMIWTYRQAFRAQNAEERVEENLPNLSQVDLYRERILANIKSLAAYTYEEVETVSFDGVRLVGKYYAGREDAPLVIFFHGFRSTPTRDLSGIAALYLASGLNLLLVDHRAHGGSGGRSITFGVKERHDCLAWTIWAADRFGEEKKILLSGISMGGATVLMASDLDLPANVVGIISDCPYSAPIDILCHMGDNLHVPRPVSKALLCSTARTLAGFRLEEAAAVTSVANAKVPILLIHGESDDFVPPEMSRAIADAAPEGLVELHFFPGAAHGLSFLSDEEGYTALLRDFFARTTGFVIP